MSLGIPPCQCWWWSWQGAAEAPISKEGDTRRTQKAFEQKQPFLLVLRLWCWSGRAMSAMLHDALQKTAEAWSASAFPEQILALR